MTATEIVLCTLALPGVEVVTVLDADTGAVVTTIHGGRLDGERFVGAGDADGQHERARLLARGGHDEGEARKIPRVERFPLPRSKF